LIIEGKGIIEEGGCNLWLFSKKHKSRRKQRKGKKMRFGSGKGVHHRKKSVSEGNVMERKRRGKKNMNLNERTKK